MLHYVGPARQDIVLGIISHSDLLLQITFLFAVGFILEEEL